LCFQNGGTSVLQGKQQRNSFQDKNQMGKLSERQIELLKENWKEVKNNHETVVKTMYQELEERNSDFPLCALESGGKSIR
jgi:hypothetical protein